MVIFLTQLVAILGSGQGSWSHVSKLIHQGGFDEIVLITNDFGKDKFIPNENTSLVVVDFNEPLNVLLDSFLKQLRPILKGTQVGLNMISGAGKEHMALLSAILKLGFGIRLVVAGTSNDFEEL